jgi:formate hydrogenlyase subunit 6/NADH:ubiquinone oxidoreductase subunit I
MQEREGAKSIAVIGDKCTTCLACVHFCPYQAMQLGKISVEKSWQYHHPEISLKDMIRK